MVFCGGKHQLKTSLASNRNRSGESSPKQLQIGGAASLFTEKICSAEEDRLRPPRKGEIRKEQKRDELITTSTRARKLQLQGGRLKPQKGKPPSKSSPKGPAGKQSKVF